jgi:hypothetical protein
MITNDLKKLIKSIGFKSYVSYVNGSINNYHYCDLEYEYILSIDIWDSKHTYTLSKRKIGDNETGFLGVNFDIHDLEPIKKTFKKELRNIKIDSLLNSNIQK